MNIPLNPQDLLFALAPAVIAMITRPTWSGNAKFATALAVCFLAALAQVLFLGQGDLSNLPLALIKAFGVTMTVYAGILKPLWPQALNYLETQINGGSGPAAPPAGPGPFPGIDAGVRGRRELTLEHLGLNYILGPAIGLGLPGLFFLVWYFDGKARDKDAAKHRKDMTEMLNVYREDTKEILAAYKADMQARSAMYDANVILVKNYESIATSLKDMVMLNTAQFEALNHNVQNNLFCPLNRVKRAGGVPE